MAPIAVLAECSIFVECRMEVPVRVPAELGRGACRYGSPPRWAVKELGTGQEEDMGLGVGGVEMGTESPSTQNADVCRVG